MTIDAPAKIMQHLTMLCQEVGPRPIGSTQNQAAADYIQRVFVDAGLDVIRQEFTCPQWASNDVSLTYADAVLDARVNPFSPSCDVHVPMLWLSTVAELSQADLTEKIAVLYGDLAQGPIAPLNSPIYLPEDHKIIGQLLRDKQPRAIIMVSDQSDEPLPLLEDWTLPIPSVTVSAESGLRLLHHADDAVRLRITSTRSESSSCNIIGKTAGNAQKSIVLCAHFDTKFGTPGAFDNGSGIAVLLTLATALRAYEGPYDFEFIAFNGEEYNGLGDEAYLQQHGLKPVRFGEGQDSRSPELAHIHAAINMDGVGQALGTNTVSIMNGSDAQQQTVADTLPAYPAVLQTDPWPASNHYTFYSHGVPSLVMGNSGGANIMHLATDTMGWMSEAKLKEVVEFVMSIVRAL